MTSWPALIDSKVENTPELEIRFYDIVLFFFKMFNFNDPKITFDLSRSINLPEHCACVPAD